MFFYKEVPASFFKIFLKKEAGTSSNRQIIGGVGGTRRMYRYILRVRPLAQLRPWPSRAKQSSEARTKHRQAMQEGGEADLNQPPNTRSAPGFGMAKFISFLSFCEPRKKVTYPYTTEIKNSAFFSWRPCWWASAEAPMKPVGRRGCELFFGVGFASLT